MAAIPAIISAANAGAFTAAGTAGTAAVASNVAGAALAATAAAALPAAIATVGVGQAVTARNAAEAQAEQAEINARQIRLANQVDIETQRRRSRARIGAAEARIGASGTTRSGSAISLISDEVFESELNESIILAQGGQAVTRQQNLARRSRTRGRNALTSGSINAVTSGIQLGTRLGSIL